MARRVSRWVEVEGPLFEEDVRKVYRDAVAEGLEELTDEGAAIEMAIISASGRGVVSGRFVRGVDGTFDRAKGEFGVGVIRPMDVWPEPHRPTMTWIDRGQRRGKYASTNGRGIRFSSKTLTRVNSLRFDVIAEKVGDALNG